MEYKIIEMKELIIDIPDATTNICFQVVPSENLTAAYEKFQRQI